MNIFQSNETFEIAPGIEGKILSARIQSPLDQLILNHYINYLKQHPSQSLYYLGLEQQKQTYGAPTNTYKFAVSLSLLNQQEIDFKDYIPLPLFKKE
ncbi:MAG: hypothetical protein AABX37_04405 [Nanoarchaeota archaeon]